MDNSLPAHSVPPRFPVPPPRVVVIMPALNEAAAIGQVLAEIPLAWGESHRL